MPITRSLLLSSVLGPVLLLGQAALTHAETCRLALVLALDVSGSVSAAEDRLQREGLAAALLAPEVTRAFLSGEPVALYVFEWAGTSSQAALLPGWEIIDSEPDLLRVAGAIRRTERAAVQATGLAGDGTAVGSSLIHAATALAAGPRCRERTVDLSGDGVNSQGIEPRGVIQSLYDGVTVNALAITSPQPIDPWQNDELVAYFEAEVVHGPSSFLVIAKGYDDYERAMSAKLLRELQVLLASRPTEVSPRT